MEKEGNCRLALFDIDGTMISSGKGALASLKKAIEDYTGMVPEITYLDTAGRTDRLIIGNLLRKLRIPEERIPSAVPDILRIYLSYLPQLYNAENDARIFPGVEKLIRELHARKDIILGLITGNVEEGARIKLGPFGLNQYFCFGAFGSDAIDREKLPEIALHRAQQLYDMEISGSQVTIVGDTVHDVTCGKQIGARAFAVIRREEYRDEIMRENPYFACTGFDNHSLIMEKILE